MGVFGPEHEQELLGENASAHDHNDAEQSNATNDLEIERSQMPRFLTSGEGGNKNVTQQIRDYDKDHGQPAKRPYFRDGAGLTCEKTDEENGDLSLETIEDSVGGLAANKPMHGAAILGVLRRAEIDHSRAVTAEQKILQHNYDGSDRDSNAGIEKKYEGKQYKNR